MSARSGQSQEEQPPSLLQMLQDFIASLPVITRYLFVAMCVFSIGANMGLIKPIQLVLLPSAYKSFELWRFFTCNIVSLGFNMLFDMYMLYQTSMYLETVNFSGKPGDYAFYVFFCMTLLNLIALFFGFYLMTPSFMMALTYRYAMSKGTEIISFMYGMQFPAMYLPWVMTLMSGLMAKEWITPLIGMAVGHLFHFIDIVYPSQNNGQKLLTTPAIFHEWFPPTQGVTGVQGPEPTARQPQRPSSGSTTSRAFSGKGIRLGE